MINSTSSKNYAKALAELSSDNILSFENIANDLNIVSDILNNSKDLQNTLENITISQKIKNDIINEVFKNQINEKIINFLKILVDKSKFNEFFEIKKEFDKILYDVNNIKRATVKSAVTLSENQKTRIIEKLQSKLNKTIIADWVESPEIIGGLIIKIDDNVIDSSLRTKLKNLEITK